MSGSDPLSAATISAERQLELFNRSSVVVYTCKASGDFAATHVGPGIRRQLGWTQEEFLQTPGFWTDNIHPDDRARVFEDLGPLFAEGRYTHEYRFRHKDGGYRWMRDELVLEYDAAGAPAQIVGYWTDVTQRKDAEEALRAREEHYRRLVELSPDGVMVHTDGIVTFANAALATILGASTPDRIVGRRAIDFVPPEDRDTVRERRRQASEGTHLPYRETKYVRLDGTLIEVGRSISQIVWQGKPSYLVMTRDITAAKEHEARLRDSEAMLRSITDGVPAMIDYVGRDGRIRFANRQFAAWFGRPLEEVIGMHVRDLRGAAKYDAQRHYMERVLAGQEMSYEGSRDFDGETRHYHATHIPRFAADGSVGGYFALILDITERKQAERELHQVGERFARVAENSPSAIFLKDLDGKFVLVNRRFEDWYGVTAAEIVGKTSFDIYPRAFAEQYVAQDREVLQSGETRERELLVPFADGTEHSVIVTKFPVTDADGLPIGVGTLNTDVTEYRNIEQQLQQAQKMEAVGQLTGGVAHDFNNLLTVILGNLQLAEGLLGADSAARPMLKIAVNAVLRGADLTQRLLAFSRRQPLSPQVTEINALVDNMSALLQRALGEQIEIVTVAGRGLWPAMVDSPQLENALLNIALNARDAMPEGGKLTIETAAADLDAEYARRNPDVVAGRYVMLAISDSGAGMTRDVLEQVFDPFFTTKDVGRGTGLGLSMVYGFIKQSGGHVSIYSEPGHGTTVRLYLPRAYGELAAEGDNDGHREAVMGSEKILVVEDDPDVRVYVVTVLGALGYDVVQAGDGRSALDLLERHRDVDLLFTDIVLPGGMNGRAIADEARRRRAGIRVVFTSGHSENAIVHDGRLDEGVDLLPKPFTRAALARMIRAALDRATI